ncbi:7-carboxy-7-deazaguanine synthase QueE [Kitasatospora sp. NPDC056076]|uniref:7-carboxy-7-deazaguanine synthase QueE n=1 Tax=Kitasatospora sp. NPDC056076 TaxID=3345703 RepID=UPI0035E1025C
MTDTPITPRRYDGHLPLNETFGPVPQGEGPYLGRRCSFVRLGHCNLSCPGCDTARTWDRARFDLDAENPLTPVEDILGAVARYGTVLTVISGGEPLMWQKTLAFDALLRGLGRLGVIHVETNGTIAPGEATAAAVAHFTVSPKIGPLASPRDPAKRRIRPKVLAEFVHLAAAGRACFKLVCATAEDVDAVAEFARDHYLHPQTVWVMPYGESPGEVAARQPVVTQAAMRHGFNATTRLHLIADMR